MHTIKIDCVHCKRNLGDSHVGESVLKFNQLGAAIKSEKYRRFYCEKCNRSTVVRFEGNEWVILPVAPLNLILPHYCTVHRFSYFDPAGECPFCELGEEKIA